MDIKSRHPMCSYLNIQLVTYIRFKSSKTSNKDAQNIAKPIDNNSSPREPIKPLISISLKMTLHHSLIQIGSFILRSVQYFIKSYLNPTRSSSHSNFIWYNDIYFLHVSGSLLVDISFASLMLQSPSSNSILKIQVL